MPVPRGLREAAPFSEPTTPTPAPTASPSPGPVAEAASVEEPAPRPATPRPAVVITTSTQQAELRTLALINSSRAQGGLSALALDAAVSRTARDHSAAEASVGYVYHDGPDGDAKTRDSSGCGTGWYGENTGKVWNGNVDVLHWEFMAEPWIPINHRTNIMDAAFSLVGIGAVQAADAIYLTMVFCR